ncbi:transporter, major facilitator family protein [Aeromicrobium marinum DSM 15272]|uniref:Transporter, major facilitator family protein n=1 Tax=Aeromicrobium marinum DSM 15272 TaxID=585531 RepID=E2SFD8_9ACTN|nr:MFS transporter [Aeromicrobium marinum]EFQ82039.1 transporter, major facilitator family protein [Aeromicrobium marinum DSM 15272]
MSRAAGWVWAVAFSVYLLAVFHRSSLAVAGLVASERFGITAAQLATFVTLQLLVYASLQIPVGLAIDRLGPRRVLTCGLVVMTVGQLTFAVVDTYPAAVLARVLVGAGDAMTFGCVLRLVSAWFSPRRVPLMTQLTGVGGQFGAILAAVPMTWAFGEFGWTRTYAGAASIGIVLLVALLLVVHDAPGARRVVGPRMSVGLVRRSLADSWSHPGTRLGFWTHFTTQFSATTLGMLWGYPFLVRGEGRSEATAGVLLTVLVVAVMTAGPIIAWLVTRHPYHRSDLVMGVVGAIVVVWTLVLAWPGDAPLAVLVALVVVVGIGGPASMIGFEYGREFNPSHRLGAAIGIINQGGFLATLVLVVAIGLVLDWRTPEGAGFTPEAFRWAMACQYVLWALGLGQIWRYRRRTRRLAGLRTP